jgi:hypothetical protein
MLGKSSEETKSGNHIWKDFGQDVSHIERLMQAAA